MLEPTLAVPLHEEVVPLAGRGGQGHGVSILICIQKYTTSGNFKFKDDEHHADHGSSIKPLSQIGGLGDQEPSD